MPTKHNKKRYIAKPKARDSFALSGRVFLRFRDEEAMLQAGRGDALLYPSIEALCHAQEYEAPRHAGYFKVDVHDGKDWKPLLLQGLFEMEEHRFAKSDRPADVAALCAETLIACKGKTVERTYREHLRLQGETSEIMNS